MALLDTRARRLTEWTLTAPALGWQRAVHVPSAWEDYGLPKTYEGACEYLYVVPIEPSRGRHYWLHCGGVSYEVRGFLNETLIGVHKGIWDSFSWDITSAIREGENRLRLSIIKNGGTTYPVPQVLSGFLPYVSSTFGGIWQPVSLFETGAAWLVDLWVCAEADGRVRVQGEIGGALPATVRLTVFAPSGQQVHTAQFEAEAHWAHQFQLSEPQAWHPRTPHLYRIVAEVFTGNALSHCVQTEFGLRTVRIDGATILLNDEPFYPRGVLHWGWYLHTHAPYPEQEQAKRELQSAQRCGFNMLKACLWVPSREYLALCDRLGMAVWLELPLWLPAMNAEQIAQAQSEYAAIVKQVRNHPSILLWTLGCELSTRFPSAALGELYALVKQLTGSPLVRDNSGGGECYGGALCEYADFADYHLYGDAHFARTTFRAFLDTLRPPAPWLQGEFADHDTQRDFATLRRTVPPAQRWWLERDPDLNPQGVRWFYETPFVEERMQQAGLADALPELVETSRREMHAYHKLVLETMRSLPQTSGYVVTGLKDTPITTSGILDERGELKISPESYALFNADTVLLLDWHRRREWLAGGDRPAHPDPYNHFGGRALYPRLAVSHFGKPVEAKAVRWRLEWSGREGSGEMHGQVACSARLSGAGITFLTQLELNLPGVATPQVARFTAELLAPSGEPIATNSWNWGVYPVPDWSVLGAVAVYDPAELLWGLPSDLPRVSGADYEQLLATTESSGVSRSHLAEQDAASRSRAPILLTTQPDWRQLEFVRRGGAALWV
ncbi:MAG: glycoside hydrolase family 2 TIM barrel-domain containing protein, partial [Armatimonadota bacterium]|nr:glycoside hydrolase family 2 TIM barrel-domain containing protein [Armatimonadota bacterium]